jgi:hypothetical protein
VDPAQSQRPDVRGSAVGEADQVRRENPSRPPRQPGPLRAQVSHHRASLSAARCPPRSGTSQLNGQRPPAVARRQLVPPGRVGAGPACRSLMPPGRRPWRPPAAAPDLPGVPAPGRVPPTSEGPDHRWTVRHQHGAGLRFRGGLAWLHAVLGEPAHEKSASGLRQADDARCRVSALAAGLSAGWNTPSTRIMAVAVFSRQCSCRGGRCTQLPADSG